MLAAKKAANVEATLEAEHLLSLSHDVAEETAAVREQQEQLEAPASPTDEQLNAACERLEQEWAAKVQHALPRHV